MRPRRYLCVEMSDSIEWIRSGHRLAEVTEPWRELLGRDATPFDCPDWFTCWWSAFPDRAQLCVCAAWRGDRLVGILPLAHRSRQGLAALSNDHSPLFRPAAADATALSCLASAALGDGSGAIEIFGLPDRDPTIEALRARAGQLGMRQLEERAHTSPIVETGGDRTAWLAASKPQWGAPLERFRRKMGRDHEAHFTVVETPIDVDQALARGFAVEASGWKGEQGTAILSSRATEAFYRGIAHAFHARGELRLSSIELDGRLAAFDLTLLQGNRLHLIKTGFDEDFRKLAPGLVLRLSVIERCFELGLDAHELLGADSEWKRKFATGERRHATFRAFARGPVGTSRYGYRALARPLLKRVRDRAR